MRALFLAILIIISTVTFGQNPDCKQFRNGVFKIVDKKTGTTIITRKGSKQIEYNKKFQVKFKFKVKWIDNCTYTLKLKRILEDANHIGYPESQILTVRIIGTKEDSYIQRTTSNLVDFVYKSELFRIK